MRTIDTVYIDGAFVTPHGDEQAPLFNPSTEEQIGTVRLGDAQDVEAAVAAAKRAFPAFSRTPKAERIAMLDLVSSGRAEWGTGSSASRAELEGCAECGEEFCPYRRRPGRAGRHMDALGALRSAG